MSAPKIVFLDAATADAGDLDFEPLRELGDLQRHETTSPDEISDRIEGAQVVLTNKVVLDAETIATATGLQMIGVCATGINNVDLSAAREHGITVCNVCGYSTPTVAQHTISLLLNLAGNNHLYANEAPLWAESPIFTRLDHPVIELEGRTLGIVGAGSIGGRVGSIAEALGMDVQVLARPGSLTARHPEWPRVEEDAFFATSDAISLHCPLTAENTRMINAGTLRQMKSTAFLINTGRGDLVDETALADALRNHRIGGAALDVLSVEPPPADHPLLAEDIPNLIVTPHCAWISKESRTRLLEGVAANIQNFFAGTPSNVVS